MEVEWVPLDEAVAMVCTGEITNAAASPGCWRPLASRVTDSGLRATAVADGGTAECH